MGEGLQRWWDEARAHVKIVNKCVVIHFEGEELVLGPVEDLTQRKALWTDCHHLLCQAFQCASSTTPKHFENQEAIIQEADRLVGFLRLLVSRGENVARGVTLDLCLESYRLAKEKVRAPSVYDRLLNKELAELVEEQAKQQGPPPLPNDQPSPPEAEVEPIYDLLKQWQERRRLVAADLDAQRRAHIAWLPVDRGRATSRWGRTPGLAPSLFTKLPGRFGGFGANENYENFTCGRRLPLESFVHKRPLCAANMQRWDSEPGRK